MEASQQEELPASDQPRDRRLREIGERRMDESLFAMDRGGAGRARLMLMVTTILERMTTLDGPGSESKSAG
jgi:hypothetical protein